MKICDCKCYLCEDDKHGQCEFECDGEAYKERQFEEYGDNEEYLLKN